MFGRRYTSEEIVAGLLAHNHEMYRYVDAIYRPKVIRHVRRNSGSRQDGEDLYQETISIVYVSLEQGRYDANRGKFGAYFMGVVYNLWISKLNKAGRGPDFIPIEPYEEVITFDETAQAQVA